MENNAFSFFPHHSVFHRFKADRELGGRRAEWIKQSTSFGVTQTGFTF